MRPSRRTPGPDQEIVMPAELHPDLERARRRAKALLCDLRDGDPDALARARLVLGERIGRPCVLADAQHVVARELGHRSWPALRRAVAQDAAAREETVLEIGAYAPGAPVEVRVRRRHQSYVIDDDGAAVRRAGRPPGWLAVAERVVGEEDLNINRRGVVFVPVAARNAQGGLEGRRVQALARRVAVTSRAVHDALLELDS
jgi:hypothetical protein